MGNSSAILHASTITGEGKRKPIQSDDTHNAIEGNNLVWIHLDANHCETRQWLEENATYLDPIIINALLANETRPRILDFKNGAMIILRGVNLNENAEAEDMVSIRLWIDDRRIISIQRRPIKAVEDINERFDSGKGPRNSGEFIAMLIGRLLDRMEPVFSELDERLDNIEEKVMEDPQSNEQREITSIRRQAIMFRRYIAPQRDAIARLRSIDQPWMKSIHNRRLQETLDQVIRYTENLDAIRERAQIVKDELASTLANRMNKNIYALSVVAAIFLPLGFLTGLLGINIGGIPGSENNQAFAIFCGLLVGVVALQIVVFKKMKWF